ncbi:MAG: phosphotransferase [Anaerolineales bacterium]|nr:phosphotransferase [Anaerolineales bacterium]
MARPRQSSKCRRPIDVQDFEQLTWRGKIRRLRKLAHNALQQFDMAYTDLRLVGWYTNLLFRVFTPTKDSYVLRICGPGWRTDEDLRAEAAWLQALNCDTDIGVPQPQAARNGDFIVEAAVEGVPGSRRCVLQSWLPGVPLEKRLTPENLYKMGVLFARLHAHTANFTPPPDFTTRKMDKVLARDEEDVLFLAENADAFTPHTRAILECTRARVAAAYAELYAAPGGLQVIHHDLWHGNIKVYRGKLHPLDFEDTVWGYAVQDLAMALQDLMSDVEPDDFEPLQAALRAGYESLRTWPEAYPNQIDIFRAGRTLWVANYVARFQRKHLKEHLDWLAPQLEGFLETGLVHK